MTTLKAITESLKDTGTSIIQETDQLKANTSSQLGQINDTCKSLPPILYQALEPGFPSWQALLDRSDTERDRLGTALKMTAQALEHLEDSTKASFTPKSK